MPNGPNSIASALAIAYTPALQVMLCTRLGIGMNPSRPEMWMIRPQPRCFIPGITARAR